MTSLRSTTLALAALSLFGLGCQGPLFYGGGHAGLPGSYAPVQSVGAPPAGRGTTVPVPQATGLDPWTPEMRGGAQLADTGGAWAAGPSRGAADPGSRIVTPGSTGIGAPSAPRYGDTGVVHNEPHGSTVALDAPARQLEPGGSGRPLMLEQFQRALEERDTLRLEVDTLTRELELLQGRLAELQQILQGGDTQRLALEQQLAAATRRVVDLEGQNTDLAARLATAQIRRLEAEKDLIQVLIDGQRSGVPAVGPSSEAAPSAASGARP